jgi:hypothetical protein
MAAIYYYDFACGYKARVKGSSAATVSDNFDRYTNIFIKPAAEKLHKQHCTKCKK